MTRPIVCLAIMLIGGVCGGQPAQGQGPFADVPPHHWAYDAINEFAALGIFSGYPDQSFAGDRGITRYEVVISVQRLPIAVYMHLRSGLPPVQPPKLPPGPPLGDVPDSHWAVDAVAEMSQQGFVVGYPNGTFAGDRVMTRYEFAALLHRFHDWHCRWVERGEEYYRRQQAPSASPLSPPGAGNVSNTPARAPGTPVGDRAPPTRRFPDVPLDHWAYPAVDALALDGILAGYPDQTFRGARPLTRYEFAMAIHRVPVEFFRRVKAAEAAATQRSDP